MLSTIPSLYVAPSQKGGRGVFTSASIPRGTKIESSPVIVLPEKDRSKVHATLLHDYYFIWGEKDDKCAIVLGYGSIYNHQYEPNAEYEPDFIKNTLHFYALRDIKAGEEITVNYSGDPEGKIDLWFEQK